jgi:hypothetical protein
MREKMNRMASNEGNLRDRLWRMLYGTADSREYCNFSGLQRLQMKDVHIWPDRESLRHGTPPHYLIVCYKGIPVATAYDDRLVPATPLPFKEDPDRQRVERLFIILRNYYG